MTGVRPLRILVVDDEPDNLELAREILGVLGHAVVTRPNGRQALELLHDRGEAFDAVLLDTIMPGIDGLEATRRLRADLRTRELVILCVAARSDGSDAQEGLAAGCDGYIKKPYQRSDLLEALTKALITRGVIGARETLESAAN